MKIFRFFLLPFGISQVFFWGCFRYNSFGKWPEVLAHPRSASENVSGGCQVGRPRFFSGKWRHLFGGSWDLWANLVTVAWRIFFSFFSSCVVSSRFCGWEMGVRVIQIQQVQSPQKWQLGTNSSSSHQFSGNMLAFSGVTWQFRKKTPFWNAFPLTIEGLFDGVLLLKDPPRPSRIWAVKFKHCYYLS